MEQDSRQAFWRFTIRYNVILLGGLYLAIFIMATFTLKSRMQGVMHVELMLIYLVTLLISFVSWIFCIVKSWKLTKFDLKLRVVAMAYLFGCPLVLFYISFPIMFFILRLMGVWSPIRQIEKRFKTQLVFTGFLSDRQDFTEIIMGMAIV